MTKKKRNDNMWGVVVIVIALTLLPAIYFTIDAINRESVKNQCTDNEVYEQSSNSCRTKTVSERFNEQCKDGITINGTVYSCSDIRKADLEEAYLRNKTIVEHGDSIYELGSYSEIQAGKEAGEYCLSASDAWSHVGEKRCVAFYPSYFAKEGNNYFIDEKKDYKTGFVVYMYGNYGWNWFISTYENKGVLLVCGTITTYEGHPEIKATPADIVTSPKLSADHLVPVYRHSCN